MEKLIIKTQKAYKPGDRAVRIPIEIMEKVEEICHQANRQQKDVVAEMLEFALEHCEIQ